MIYPIAAVAMMCAFTAAHARDLPVTVVTETQPYASADQAAIAALRIAMPRSLYYENGGAIVEKEGNYYYSTPVSNGQPGHIAFRVAAPEGSRLAAIYHTHPGNELDSRMFSWDDVKEARALRVNSYIGVLRDGTIRFFDPRTTPTRRYESPGTLISPGSVSDGVIITTLVNFVGV